MSKRQLVGDEDLVEYTSLWQRSRKGLFKLETLQAYSPDLSPGWSEFKRGDLTALKSLLSESLKSDPAYDLIKARNLYLERIHIVELPLSEFMKYEIQSYFISEELGEQIFFATQEQIKKITIPVKLQDFLLFDEQTIILQLYNANGSYQSAELLDDKNEIEPYINLKNQLKSISIPLKDFARAHLQEGKPDVG